MKFSFLKWIRSNDQFGKEVGLTLQGKDKYLTIRGGFITLFYLAYLAYYSVG